jgi:hypothetical protein
VCYVLHCSAGPQVKQRIAQVFQCQLTGPNVAANGGVELRGCGVVGEFNHFGIEL